MGMIAVGMKVAAFSLPRCGFSGPSTGVSSGLFPYAPHMRLTLPVSASSTMTR